MAFRLYRQNAMPRYTPLVAELPSTVPFIGPEAQERNFGRPFQARIGANENVFGASPKAMEAMQQALTEVWQYADPESHDLKVALAQHHGVSPQNIAIDAGIDTVLGLLVRLLIDPGDVVVTSHGAYPTFNFQVAGFGGRLEMVPFDGVHEDRMALLARGRETDAKLIYISNPDNPWGSWHGADAMQEMIDQVPDGAVLCIDEAYGEFAAEGTMPAIDVGNPNIIRMRTFSKAYGMAGARVGYCIAHEDLASSFDKIRNHFGQCRISQIGALAALRDQEWLAKTCAMVRRATDRLSQIAKDNGMVPLPTATNFVTMDLGKDRPVARAVMTELAHQGIFVRMPFVDPENRHIRVSAGTDENLDLFAQVLPKALASVGASS